MNQDKTTDPKYWTVEGDEPSPGKHEESGDDNKGDGYSIVGQKIQLSGEDSEVDKHYQNPNPFESLLKKKPDALPQINSLNVGDFIDQYESNSQNKDNNVPMADLMTASPSKETLELPMDTKPSAKNRVITKGFLNMPMCFVYLVTIAMTIAAIIALSVILYQACSRHTSVESKNINNTIMNSSEKLELLLKEMETEGINVSAVLIQYLKEKNLFQHCSCSNYTISKGNFPDANNINIFDRKWIRVAGIDMTINTSHCPSPNFTMSNISGFSTCRSIDRNKGCYSIFFLSLNMTYTKVHGRVKAYQYNNTNSFQQYSRGNSTIDEPYVDGVSLTYGNPRRHIWTFASDRSQSSSFCPCGTSRDTAIPDFVGDDYFCDSGILSDENYTAAFSNPLWDGEGCSPDYGCCSHKCPPWFYKELDECTSDPIEFRVCRDQVNSNEDILIEAIDIFIQV